MCTSSSHTRGASSECRSLTRIRKFHLAVSHLKTPTQYKANSSHWSLTRRSSRSLEFESEDPGLADEMTITFRLADAEGRTEIVFLCDDIPKGVRPEDNEMGCRSSLRISPHSSSDERRLFRSSVGGNHGRRRIELLR